MTTHPRRRRRQAFTLTEMLVVLGIILVLLSVLLPVIVKAQKQAKLAECASRLRSIGQAIQVYMTEYQQTLPPGINGNSQDSSISGVYIASKNITAIPIGRGLPPSDQAKASLFDGAQGFGYPAAPLAYYLARTMAPTEQHWSCPNLRTGKPGNFRKYQFVSVNPTTGSDAIPPGGSDVPASDTLFWQMGGTGLGTREFQPGYYYMAGVEQSLSINLSKQKQQPDDGRAWKYHYRELARRSISGLKLAEIRPSSRNAPEQIVIAMDYNLMAHSKATDDLWKETSPKDLDGYDENGNSNGTTSPIESATGNDGNAYAANMVFLDWHVEKREFGSVIGLFRQLHGPIVQPW